MKQGKEINYSGQPIYLGIDIHKNQWTVTISTAHLVKPPITITPPFAQKLRSYLDKHYPQGNYYAAYEAGFNGFWPQRRLEGEGINTLVVHPPDIPSSEKTRLQKTDKKDSRVISRSLRSGELTGIYVPSEQMIKDRNVVRERWNIAKSQRRIKHQNKSQLLFLGIPIPEQAGKKHWARKFIGWLEQGRDAYDDEALGLKIERLEMLRKLQLVGTRHLRKMARSEPYAELYGLLNSVPGVSLLTAMQLITEIMDIHRFPRLEELCSYVGLIPYMRCSGDYTYHGEMTHRGNARLRKSLILSSWNAIQTDSELLMKFEQFKKHGKTNKAIVKIARILLRRIRRVWLSKEPYQKAIF
jgi:transposase